MEPRWGSSYHPCPNCILPRGCEVSLASISLSTTPPLDPGQISEHGPGMGRHAAPLFMSLPVYRTGMLFKDKMESPSLELPAHFGCPSVNSLFFLTRRILPVDIWWRKSFVFPLLNEAPYSIRALRLHPGSLCIQFHSAVLLAFCDSPKVCKM